MKKTKKIPNTPKYKFGGGFDSKDKANVRNFIGNSAKMYADTALNAVGVDAVGAGKGMEYKGTSANKFNQASNVTGELSKKLAPAVANVLLPGSGQVLSMGQQVAGGAYGKFGPQNEQGFNAYDADGNPIMNEGDNSAQIAQIAGQIGGMASGFMGGSPGGMPGGAGATPAMVAKYGGYMKYAMGGMQYANGGTGQINSEVEGAGFDENGNPKDGENAIGPNNEFTQFKGATHAQGGIKTDMAPGTRIFSDKLKAPGTNKTFAKLNAGNNTNREDKLDTKEYLDPKSKMSIDLTRMAKMKNSDMLFAMQEQLKKNKVAAYAKRMGVELPSMDNEQMEPQGMPEQVEGEMVMAKYGGMMNRMAMGGVQLPYYNINRDGTNKYAMGGMGVDPAMPAANTGTVAPTMSTPPQFGNRMEFDKYYQSQGFAKDPRNKLEPNVTYYNPNKYKYDQGTDSFKFANNEPVPYNSLPSSDLMEFKPGSGVQKVVNKKVPVGQQSLNKWDFNSGIPTKRYYNEAGELLKSEEYDNAGPSGKVLNTIEPRRKLAYGGMMPKYALGGEEEDDNGFGYTPNNPAEAYRMQQASKMNNRIYSQRSSYAPSVLPWEKTNDSGNTPNNPYTFPVQEENPDMVNRRNDRLAREAAEIAGTSGAGTDGTEDTTGTSGGNKYNNRDMALQGLGMVAGLSPKLAYLKNQGKKYDTQEFYGYDPSLMDPTQARKDEQYAYRQSLENLRVGATGNAANLLRNTDAQRNKTSANLGRINKEYDNANVAITNRGKEYNIGNRYAVDDINARNKGAALSNYYKTLDSTGAEVKQGTKDIRAGNQDKQMMAMIPKMINDPQFKKFFEEYQKGQVG
jgi:hypothetical protein